MSDLGVDEMRLPARAPGGGARPRLSLEEARALLAERVSPLDASELVPVTEAPGRVTSHAVHARSSVPHFRAAAMDGIAVRARDTAAARKEQPVELEIALALDEPGLAGRPFAWIDTGQPVPRWADAVVMVERVEPVQRAAGPPERPETLERPEWPERRSPAARARQVRLRAPAAAWQHVRLIGEDVVAGELLVPRGQRLGAQDIGALLAAGVVEVAVRPRPVVAIVPTGDELVEPGEALAPGKVVESNSRMIAACVREWGGEPRSLALVRDDLEEIAARVGAAARDADVVCVLAGSSAGRRDFTASVLGRFGTVLAQGIAVVPGRPTLVATVEGQGGPSEPTRARAALGIPGYPVAAAVICRELLEPLLAHLLGTSPAERPRVRAVLARALASKPGHEELVRVCLAEIGGRIVARPLARGAGAIAALARADGLARVPRDLAGIEAGSEVEVELLRPLAQVRGTIAVSGASDPALALLDDALRASDPALRLVVRPVGARAGLGEVSRGEAHGASLVGEELERLAPNGPGRSGESAAAGGLPACVVVHLARREVGLLVAPGNPLGLQRADDLARPDVRAIPTVVRGEIRFAPPLPRGLAAARQGLAARSGTARSGLGAEPSTGGDAEAEELSPLAVAAAVADGLADAGFATRAAAAAFGLGFVPLGTEDVALVLRADVAATPAGRSLLAVASSAGFRTTVERLEGYDAALSGDERALGAPPGPLVRGPGG